MAICEKRTDRKNYVRQRPLKIILRKNVKERVLFEKNIKNVLNVRYIYGFLQYLIPIFTNARTAADDQQELDPVLMTRIRQPVRRMGAK